MSATSRPLDRRQVDGLEALDHRGRHREAEHAEALVGLERRRDADPVGDDRRGRRELAHIGPPVHDGRDELQPDDIGAPTRRLDRERRAERLADEDEAAHAARLAQRVGAGADRADPFRHRRGPRGMAEGVAGAGIVKAQAGVAGLGDRLRQQPPALAHRQVLEAPRRAEHHADRAAGGMVEAGAALEGEGYAVAQPLRRRGLRERLLGGGDDEHAWTFCGTRGGGRTRDRAP